MYRQERWGEFTVISNLLSSFFPSSLTPTEPARLPVHHLDISMVKTGFVVLLVVAQLPAISGMVTGGTHKLSPFYLLSHSAPNLADSLRIILGL